MSSLISGEPLRVLVVTPHAFQREEVGSALQSAGDHRLYWVTQPDLALTRAQGLAPHVVLIDTDATPGQVTADNTATLIRRFVEGLPDSTVLLLAEPGAWSIAQAAVLAGARAFVLKPVKSEELIPMLRQVLGHRLAAPAPLTSDGANGRVVVFCGSKGGTGRTTLAINTAICLREVTRQPLVIVDADYAAPAIDVALNLRGQRDIRDLLPKLNQLDADLIHSVLAQHPSGVKVLLAPPPDELEYPPTLPQVQQVVAWLKRIFPWVLVDLGLPLDEAAYAFLDVADYAVMSVLPDMVGMRNAKLMLAQFEARNYSPTKMWPLLNREGLPGGVKKHDVEAYLERPLKFAIPNDQELATETINRGVPMVIAHRRRPVAQAYRRLAALLVDASKQGAQVFSSPALAGVAGEAARVSAPQPRAAEARVSVAEVMPSPFLEPAEPAQAEPKARAATRPGGNGHSAALPQPTRPSAPAAPELSQLLRNKAVIGGIVVFALLLVILLAVIIALLLNRASAAPPSLAALVSFLAALATAPGA